MLHRNEILKMDPELVIRDQNYILKQRITEIKEWSLQHFPNSCELAQDDTASLTQSRKKIHQLDFKFIAPV